MRFENPTQYVVFPLLFSSIHPSHKYFAFITKSLDFLSPKRTFSLSKTYPTIINTTNIYNSTDHNNN